MTLVKRKRALEGVFDPLVMSIPPGTAPNQRDRYRDDDRDCADEETDLSGSHFTIAVAIGFHIM